MDIMGMAMAMDQPLIYAVGFSPSAIKDNELLMNFLHFIGENKNNLIFFDNTRYGILKYVKEAIATLDKRDLVIAQKVFLELHRKKYRIVTFEKNTDNICNLVDYTVEKGQPSLVILSEDKNIINTASLAIEHSCHDTCRLLTRFKSDQNTSLLTSAEAIVGLETLSTIGIDGNWTKNQLDTRIFGPLFKYTKKITIIDVWLGKNLSQGKNDMLQFLITTFHSNAIFQQLKMIIYTVTRDESFELTDQEIKSQYSKFRRGNIEFVPINAIKRHKYHDRHIITDQFTLLIGRSLDITDGNTVIADMETTIGIIDEKQPGLSLNRLIQEHRK